MSTKLRYLLPIALILLLCIGLVCLLYVDGSRLPLPEGIPLSGNAVRMDLGPDPESAAAAHDRGSIALTQEQIHSLLELLRGSSYRRTLHGSSVTFNGNMDRSYAIGLVYRLGDRNETVLISITGNGLISIVVGPDTATGFLKVTDPHFLSQLEAILHTETVSGS